MEKANSILAGYDSTKKQEKSEYMEHRRIDRETHIDERYDPCDDGSAFENPEETQLLPENQTLLVHRLSDPLSGTVLSHGVKNRELACPSCWCLEQTINIPQRLPFRAKTNGAQHRLHLDLNCVLNCVWLSLISGPMEYEDCLKNDDTHCRVNGNGDDIFLWNGLCLSMLPLKKCVSTC
jgi:hypothetical protein